MTAVADTVAAVQGPERQGLHSVERYAAATVHALRESVGRGHCCLPATALRYATAEVLCKPGLGARQLRGAEEVQVPLLTEVGTTHLILLVMSEQSSSGMDLHI